MGKQKNQNNVIKIYQKCADVEQNKFWKQFFLDLSRNKCPRSLFMTPNGDLFKYKKSTEIVTLDQNSPKDKESEEKEVARVSSVIKSALSNTGICPNTESKEESSITNQKPTRWAEIKRKSLKDYYILKYISKLKMTREEKEKYYNAVDTAILLGCAKIDFDDGEIQNITILYGSGKDKNPKRNSNRRDNLILLKNFWSSWKKE
jgi:hypothetical protein